MMDFGTASPEAVRRVYDAIAAEMGDDRFFTTKELDLLPRMLARREQVLAFSSGYMDGDSWLIVLTDQRVLFLDKKLLFGVRQTSIELRNIVTIHGDTGVLTGSIRIGAADGEHEIRNVWKRTVNPFVNKTREAMNARLDGVALRSPGAEDERDPPAPAPAPAPVPTPAPAPTPSSGASARVERLDRLLRSGAIDAAEHARQMRDVAR